MSSRCDEVEQDVHAIIPEARVTLDTGLFRKDVVVLPFKIPDNLGEAREGTISLVYGLSLDTSPP